MSNSKSYNRTPLDELVEALSVEERQEIIDGHNENAHEYNLPF